MRKLLNTLHVMTQGAYLHRDGETIAIKVGQDLKLRIPIHTLEGLVCWEWQVACSPPVLGLCCERGVGISFLTEQGRFLARVSGPVSGNVLLRRQQYRMADGAEGALPTVRTIVAAKIANSRVVLLRAAREVADEARENPLREAANRLSWAGLEAARAPSTDEARGYEGSAGQTYAMSGVTSIKKIVKRPSKVGPLVTMALGAVMAIVSSIDGHVRDGDTVMVFGIVFFLLGLLILLMSKSIHAALIHCASGETQAFPSKDEALIQEIMEALNRAIVIRG